MNDDETWVEGDHANTLNSFDAGDVRTTHAVIAKTVSTLQAQHGRGFAINAEMAAGGQLIPSVLASFYFKGGSLQGFAREDNVLPTLMTESGVGIASSGEIIAYGVSASDDEVAGTLCTNSQGGQRTTDIAGAYVTETFPIDDGRDLEKHQNGTCIGAAGDPAYTIDRQQRPAVAHLIPFDTNFSNQQAPGGTTAATLDTRGTQGVAHLAATLTSGGHPNSNAPGRRNEDDVNLVGEQMSVRRLTPTECERLMGWPDEWTAPEGVKAPDSKRYAACGDGIVAPVAFWIADRIRMIEGEA